MIRNTSRNIRVPREDWLKCFDRFAGDNEGRPVRLEALGGEMGDQELGSKLPLLAINYDARNERDTVTISTGLKEVEYEHAVDAPKEVWVEEDESGRGKAMEIVSKDGIRTILTLEQ